MQPILRIAPRLRATATLRGLRTLAPMAASVASPGRAGPPPAPPAEQSEQSEAMERVKRRRRQAEMLREAKEGKGLKKRFWKEVTVRESDGLSRLFLPLVWLHTCCLWELDC